MSWIRALVGVFKRMAGGNADVARYCASCGEPASDMCCEVWWCIDCLFLHDLIEDKK
jgi:hypothetical protein